MPEWTKGVLSDVLDEVDERNREREVSLVLSVTEGRGIVPQTEVFKKRIATEDTSKYKVLRPLDIAWNPYLLWTGAIGQWLGKEPGVTSPVYPVYRAKPGQSARFWGLVLECGWLTNYFNSRAIGSIQRRRRTTPPDFKAAPIAIPPLRVQQRIVEVVGAVDAQIAALDDEAAASARILGVLIGDLAGHSESERVALGTLCTTIGSGPSWAAGDESDVATDGSVPVLKITNTRPDGSLDLSNVVHVRGLPATTRTISETSLVLIRTNGNRSRIGNTYKPSDQAYGFAVSAFQFLLDAPDVLTRDYLYVALNDPTAQHAMSSAASGSTGLSNLALRTLRAMEIPWPDEAVRRQHVTIAAGLQGQVAASRAEAGRLRKLRGALLSALLNQDIGFDYVEDEVA